MNKIPIAILGATGIVGQKFVELLSAHPWFEIVVLCASPRSAGKKYAEATKWMMSSSLDLRLANMIVQDTVPTFASRIVFSALSSSVAGEIEENFARNGYIVISNSRNHRMKSTVPLLIPEVNGHHLDLVKSQSFDSGMIVTNPNCSVIGLSTALKPLVDRFGVERVNIVTLQAVSGAGYPGVASLDILDNVIPFISGEEEKIETEPLKILGRLDGEAIIPHQMQISAQCNRVAVVDGHLGCVSVKLSTSTTADEILDAWSDFKSESQTLGLPTSPTKLIEYYPHESHPQPKLHRYTGMTVSIGRLRKCSLLDWKFVILSHNTIRGAAGCAILNAEFMLKKGYI